MDAEKKVSRKENAFRKIKLKLAEKLSRTKIPRLDHSEMYFKIP